LACAWFHKDWMPLGTSRIPLLASTLCFVLYFRFGRTGS
jgi:hypothetical protein